MAEFDLSAERAKRRMEPKWLVMRGEDQEILAKYELAPEFPAAALDRGSAGELGAALRLLFVHSDEADEFMAKYQPSVEDLLSIMRNCYSMEKPGES